MPTKALAEHRTIVPESSFVAGRTRANLIEVAKVGQNKLEWTLPIYLKNPLRV